MNVIDPLSDVSVNTFGLRLPPVFDGAVEMQSIAASYMALSEKDKLYSPTFVSTYICTGLNFTGAGAGAGGGAGAGAAFLATAFFGAAFLAGAFLAAAFFGAALGFFAVGFLVGMVPPLDGVTSITTCRLEGLTFTSQPR